jgi:hypothetical protein
MNLLTRNVARGGLSHQGQRMKALHPEQAAAKMVAHMSGSSDDKTVIRGNGGG